MLYVLQDVPVAKVSQVNQDLVALTVFPAPKVIQDHLERRDCQVCVVKVGFPEDVAVMELLGDQVLCCHCSSSHILYSSFADCMLV